MDAKNIKNVNKIFIIKSLEAALWEQMEWSAHYADLRRNIGQKIPKKWRKDLSKARTALALFKSNKNSHIMKYS